MDKVLTITINQVFKLVTSRMRVTIGETLSYFVVSPLLTKQNLCKKKKKRFQKTCSPCSLKISNSTLTWMLLSRIVNRRNKQLGIIDVSTQHPTLKLDKDYVLLVWRVFHNLVYVHLLQRLYCNIITTVVRH
jgi:hypothetical protein